MMDIIFAHVLLWLKSHCHSYLSKNECSKPRPALIKRLEWPAYSVNFDEGKNLPRIVTHTSFLRKPSMYYMERWIDVLCKAVEQGKSHDVIWTNLRNWYFPHDNLQGRWWCIKSPISAETCVSQKLSIFPALFLSSLLANKSKRIYEVGNQTSIF